MAFDPRHHPQQQQPPMPPAPQQVVYARRGMSAPGHGFNWTLTIMTCGMWLPFYWGWWATVRSWQAWSNWRKRKKYTKIYG